MPAGTPSKLGMQSGCHPMYCNGMQLLARSPHATSCTRTPYWTPSYHEMTSPRQSSSTCRVCLVPLIKVMNCSDVTTY